MGKMFKEFKAFIAKGNVLDLAVGLMIGAAFGKIVSSLVNDVFMPVISLIMGGFNISGAFLALDGNSYPSLEVAKAAGAATLNYGAFVQAVIDFLVIALCVFLFVKAVSKIMPKKEEPKKEAPKCPYCFGEVNEKATRCPHCTSEITPKA